MFMTDMDVAWGLIIIIGAVFWIVDGLGLIDHSERA